MAARAVTPSDIRRECRGLTGEARKTQARRLRAAGWSALDIGAALQCGAGVASRLARAL